MRKEFDWDRYKKNKIWVHIKTKEEFCDYIAEARERNCDYLECKEDSFLHEDATYFCNGGSMTEKWKKSYANSGNKDFVEWSDYMDKKEQKLKEKYLVSGNVIKTRAGGMYLLADRYGKLVAYNIKNMKGYLDTDCLEAYGDDLCIRFSSKGFDIVKVFISNIAIDDCTEELMQLLWERKEEMTKEEALKVLIDSAECSMESFGLCDGVCSECINQHEDEEIMEAIEIIKKQFKENVK